VAGTSLLTLLDDIAKILRDVTMMTKAAAKQTAGVLGDDLALNAQQVAGIAAERELPVVWAVARGSLKNKVILVPTALALSAIAPWTVLPALILGGAYLCYEGVEKLLHRWTHSHSEDERHEAELTEALTDPSVDMVAFEKDKIAGAIRTDFVLSAEIIVIALGTVATATFVTRLGVLTFVALIMTVGVYGLVAGIVKLDDAGLYLTQRTGSHARGRAAHLLGRALLGLAPRLMTTLSVAGTAAMFLVGGGILTHGVPAIHHLFEEVLEHLHAGPIVGGLFEIVFNGVLGILFGAVVLAVVTVANKAIAPFRKRA